MITKSIYDDWKHLEITQQMNEDIKLVAEELAAELVVRSDHNRDRDQYIKGFIRGVQAAREWVPEFTEDEDEQS